MYKQHVVHLHNKPYCIWDHEDSVAYQIVSTELSRDSYRIAQLPIGPGDVILDIGAHIGLFAIYAANLWPFVTVHSFEAFPPNADLFERNVGAASCPNVHLHRYAITADGSPVTMTTNPKNSGGATSYSQSQDHMRVKAIPSMTLDAACAALNIRECALLKVDCEGAEYGILRSTALLPQVRHMRAEFHTNAYLAALGCDPGSLAEHCIQAAPQCDLLYSGCRMAE